MPVSGNIAGRFVWALTVDDREFVRGQKRGEKAVDDQERSFRRLLGTVRKTVKPFTDFTKRVVSLRGAMVGATAAIGGFYAFQRVAREAAEFGRELQAASDRTGVTTQRLQQLGYVTGQLGVDFQGLVDALSQIHVSIGEYQDGTRSYVDAWQELGVAIDEVRGRNPADVLDLMLQRLREIPDLQRRTFLLDTLLQTEGQRIVPLTRISQAEQRSLEARAPTASEDVIAANNRISASFAALGKTIETVTQQQIARFESQIVKINEIAESLARLQIPRIVDGLLALGEQFAWVGRGIQLILSLKIAATFARWTELVKPLAAALGTLATRFIGTGSGLKIAGAALTAIKVKFIALIPHVAAIVGVFLTLEYGLRRLSEWFADAAAEATKFDRMTEDTLRGHIQNLKSDIDDLNQKIKDTPVQLAGDVYAGWKTRLREMLEELQTARRRLDEITSPAGAPSRTAPAPAGGAEEPAAVIPTVNSIKARVEATKQYEDRLKDIAKLNADNAVAVQQFSRELVAQPTYLDEFLFKQETLRDLTAQINDLRARATSLLGEDQEALAAEATAQAENLEKLRAAIHKVGLAGREAEAILEELFTLPTVTLTTPDDPVEKINVRLRALKDVAKQTMESLNRGLQSAVVNAESFADALKRIGRLLAFEAFRAFFNPDTLRRVFTGRQSGGHVYAGTPYTVGERGAETFVPRTDGRILPSGATMASNAPIAVTTNIYPSGDFDAAAAERLSDSITSKVMTLVERNRYRRAIRGAGV